MSALIDISGQIFGKLLIIKRAENDKRGLACWLCKCLCGRETTVRGSDLRSGRTKGCGCGASKHGHTSSLGNRKTSLSFNSWRAMKARCLNPNATDYSSYGGRGISVCDRWKDSFENFLVDLGERPQGTSLGRFGDSGNYEPGNCKFMTWVEQTANRRPDRKYCNQYTAKNAEQIAIFSPTISPQVSF